MWKKAVFHTVALAIWLTLVFTEVIVRRFPQTLQGFTCDDPSLKRPYKTSNYPTTLLYKITYVVPFCVVAMELVIHGRKSLKNLMITAIRCIEWVQQYFFFFILNVVTLTYIKSISGFLRPYFLAECMPDLAINCTSGEFIEANFVCTNPNITAFVRGELGRSFPSLNTMVSTFPMVFIVWYLQRRVSRIPFLIPICGTVALAWSLLASITRITVNAHQPWEVVVTVIIFTPFWLYLNYAACKNFKVPSIEDNESFKCLWIMKCTLCKQKDDGKIGKLCVDRPTHEE